MPVVQTSLSIVLAKFPDHKDKIKRLFKEKKTFQALCEDYRQCSEALKYWNRSASDDGHARREEYSALLGELEAETLRFLSESE